MALSTETKLQLIHEISGDLLNDMQSKRATRAPRASAAPDASAATTPMAKGVKAPKVKLNGAPAVKRVVKNYPKCGFEGCEKNRSPRTSPYCGEHYRIVKASTGVSETPASA